MKYASSGKRFLAYLLDSLIVTAILYLIQWIVGMMTGNRFSFTNVSGQTRFISIIVDVCAIIILSVMESGQNRATLGKRACKIIVTRSDGSKIGMMDAMTRNCAKMLPSLFSQLLAGTDQKANLLANAGSLFIIASFIMVCAGSEKKAIHDYMAATIVVPKDMARNLTPQTIVAAAVKEVYDMPISNTVYRMPEPVREVPVRKFKLLALSGQFAGRAFNLNTPIVFGREAGKCNLVFAETTRGVSRTHGKLYLDNGRVFIEDIGSSHGTFMADGSRITPHVPTELHNGDIFYPANREETFKIIISE